MSKGETKDLDAPVGARMRQHRIEIGMSQMTLAQNLRLTFQQIQKYEKGSNRIGAGQIGLIAKALQVSPVYFYDETDVQPVEVMSLGSLRQEGELPRVHKVESPVLRDRIVSLVRTIAEPEQGADIAPQATE
ncbi:hypothetical protein BTE77_34770 [Ensifer adhaerens]|nr:hypothetical protein BTE77_34770 [Ensifer adhaerens]